MEMIKTKARVEERETEIDGGWLKEPVVEVFGIR